MDHAEPLLRWIPLLPLLTAALSGLWMLFVRRPLPRWAIWGPACAAPIASFGLALTLVQQLATELEGPERYLVDNVFTWIGVDPFYAEMSFLLDPLSAIMILVVTGVGSLIHVYSIGYMDDDHRDDRGFQRFFLYLNLFTFSMLMLVLGDNLLVMFVGWEGVGLCSYLLIGFWYLDDHNAMCGQKALVVNRIGDFGFLLGIFLLFWAYASVGHPTIEFREMAAHVDQVKDLSIALPPWLSFLPGHPQWTLLTLAGLCLFVGACGKSAQIPLYVWLPDAMAGPTPVSALIHAATMVTAGVYMVTRMSFAYQYAPGALAVIAWTGGITALFAAIVATVQTDIKKVLAYSTVSQLGYMFLAAGVASYSAAVFHLVTHAFFKALLFLGAGSVILGMHHEQNIEVMGGLRTRMTITWLTFLMGVFAISGIPPFSGFFSKDEILLGAYLAHDVPGHGVLYAMGLITAALTSYYMWRLYIVVFTGHNRSSLRVQREIHESPPAILVPLVVLAVLSVFGGAVGLPDLYGETLFGVPESNSIAYFLASVAPSAEHHVEVRAELLLMLAAVAVSLAGAAVAWMLFYFRPALAPALAAQLAPLRRVVADKFYVDELYQAAIVRPLIFLSDRGLYRIVDAVLIDRLGVNGTASLVRWLGASVLRNLQTGWTQSYVFSMVVGCVLIVAYLVSAG
jgi:NADH-quinone oxidoreductase subunit L